MRKTTNVFVLLTIILFTAFNTEQLRAEDDFELKHADNLETNQDQINVKGNVIINYKNAIINAPEGKIETNNEGKPIKAIFTGKARLKLIDRQIEADKITVSINDKVIYALGNTRSELKDKKKSSLIITCDYQELLWSGEGANATGNIKTIYEDTEVNSESTKIIYKNKKPYQALFYGSSKQSILKQPTNNTIADEFVFDIKTHSIHAFGAVKSTVWPDKTKKQNEQDPILFTTDELLIDNETNTITGKSDTNKVKLSYQETKGESFEILLLRNKSSGKPEQIIFKGQANVNQEDKQLSSEEVVFNFEDKKLTSNTRTNIRPKTVFFKK